MLQERFLQLLGRKMAGEATIQELDELEKLMQENEEWKRLTEQLMTSQPEITEQDEHEADAAFAAHSVKMQLTGRLPAKTVSIHRNRNLLKWTMRVAAVLAVLIVAAAGIYTFKRLGKNNKPAVAFSQVTTKPGSKSRIQLPDGSSVWLNASSNLTYGKDFGKNLREVNLTGEAFFDVLKDPAHPFVIHTKVLDVKVLGTEFDVKTYPNDEYTVTSLIKGSIEVRVKNKPNEKFYLKPNEKFSVANSVLNEDTQNAIKAKPYILIEHLTYSYADSSVIETSWVESKLIFQNETFKEVALKMERWYGVHISFADKEVAQIRPFGAFTNESITQALDALRESFRFNYKITGNDIVITK